MVIIKIAICGYTGKTGSKVYELLKNNGYNCLGVDENNPLENIIDNVSLIIDFTNKEASLRHIKLAISYKVDFIVATTSFSKKQLKEIKKEVSKSNIKGIICYNFSIPINYLLKCLTKFNKYFEDFEYYDIHHISKLDKRSGTTTLFYLKNNKFKIKSVKTFKNTITYIIKMKTKYDKMIITYQVEDRIVFAFGVLQYLKTKDDRSIVNLLDTI